MADVVNEYEPTDPWWTLEQLSLGDWLPVPNFRVYTEDAATTEAARLTRINNSSYRVVYHADASTSAPVGDQIDPPTTWWTVEKEDSPGSDTWSSVNNPEISGSQKFWSLSSAQATAQTTARDSQAKTRVTVIGQ